uniref:Uncharacterized protein n=1 Tax=Meloidogyne hapla TaxID=6305 RepID=A0A1I8AYU0_MELHA
MSISKIYLLFIPLVLLIIINIAFAQNLLCKSKTLSGSDKKVCATLAKSKNNRVAADENAKKKAKGEFIYFTN